MEQEHDPRQSIHEIGLATQLFMSQGRAAVVTVESPSGETRASPLDPVEEDAEHGADHDIGHDVGHDDGGDVDDSQVQDEDPEGSQPPIPEPASFTSAASSSDSVLAQAGGETDYENSDKGEHGVEIPSNIGPFTLGSQSSGSTFDCFAMTDPEPSPIDGTTEAFQREYQAIRLVEWVMKVDPTIPRGYPAPFAGLDDSDTENPENMGKDRNKDDSAIRGNFIPLSASSRARSPSPRRQQDSSGVYLQLSLTDSQMDRLTAALSPEDGNEQPPLPRGRAQTVDRDTDSMNTGKENRTPRMRSRSPAKAYQCASTPSRTRSRSPVKFNLGRTPDSQRTIQALHANTSASARKAQETRFDLDTPKAHETPTPAGERAIRSPPAPIDTELARAHARMAAMRLGKQPVVVVHNPPERDSSLKRRSYLTPTLDDSSSYYSQDSGDRYPSYISPLRVQKANEKHLSILQEYTDKRNSSRGSDKESQEPEQLGTADGTSNGAEMAYTPLAPFIPQGAPAVRKASKTLIGEGGWLENTSKPEPPASPTRAGLISSLVKKAREMMEASNDNRAKRKSRESETSNKNRPASRQLAISLSPREQSLLYCELEFALTTALNDYITAQFNAGRLEADKLKKTAEDWQRKGRPKVVGFRYDLETQLDLVRGHVNDFKFYSRPAATTAILGIIDTAKSNARVLRVRTFCQPDTVIAKQLLDSQGLFNILGCPKDQQIKLAEIVAFFKAAIERRRIHTLREQHMLLMQAQPAQEQQSGGPSGSSMAPVGAAATSPVRNCRSPAAKQIHGQTEEDWWRNATALAAAARASTEQGQVRRSKSLAAGKMDPAAYESQGE